MKKYLLKLWWCKLWRFHDWTSQVYKKEPPPEINTIEDYCKWAEMYCDRCGHVSELSKNFTKEMKERCKNLELK